MREAETVVAKGKPDLVSAWNSCCSGNHHDVRIRPDGKKFLILPPFELWQETQSISYENAPGIFMCRACCQRHHECFHAKCTDFHL